MQKSESEPYFCVDRHFLQNKCIVKEENKEDEEDLEKNNNI